ncbi:MAG: hypothetical protein ACREBV_07200 [Candidatus Zixiibacteriota bacterium]
MIRKILAVLAGVITAFVVVILVEAISALVYPPPPGLDMTDTEAMKEYVKTLPTGAFLFVLAGWTIAAFVGGLVAGFIAKTKPMLFAWIVGGVILLAGIYNLVVIPHPTWFSISAVVLILLVSFLAGKIGECWGLKSQRTAG